MRILITGSRTWKDMGLILYALSWAWAIDGEESGSSGMTLVSGACPRNRFGESADAMCEELATTWGWNVERYPADWSQGRSAGFVRNKTMVDLGADVCLAFIRNESKGATMTADLAAAAGIKTVRFVINDI